MYSHRLPIGRWILTAVFIAALMIAILPAFSHGEEAYADDPYADESGRPQQIPTDAAEFKNVKASSTTDNERHFVNRNVTHKGVAAASDMSAAGSPAQEGDNGP